MKRQVQIAQAEIDWHYLDVVIASSQGDAGAIHVFLGIASHSPAQVKPEQARNTPAGSHIEWLVLAPTRSGHASYYSDCFVRLEGH